MKIKKCGREVKVGGAGHAAREMPHGVARWAGA